MADEQHDASITLKHIEPQLFTADLAASLAFYTSVLGFRTSFTYGNPPFYAQVARDGARINLRLVHGPVFAPDFRMREADPLAATVVLADPEPLFRAWQAAGVPFHKPLRTEPWGARTFVVRDPDGNLIAFAG